MIWAIAFLALVPLSGCWATEFLVSDAIELDSKIALAKPGDSILIKDGVWDDVYVRFKGRGTESQPITLRSQTPGRVVFGGKSHIDISGEWLIVDGIRFEGGALQQGQHIIRFTGSAGDCFHCRLTNSTIVRYNPKNIEIRYFWLSLYGRHNRVDHCRFEGQRHAGPTLVVSRKYGLPDEHVVEYNHFLDRSPGAGNGFETIRIGTSTKALTESATVVQFNLFEKTNGEIEVISVKSGNNLIHSNTFKQVSGAVTLRHGNENHVTDNIFIGDGFPETSGIRVMGERHVIARNYMQNLRNKTGAAILFYCGHADGRLGGNDPVKNILVVGNLVIDIDGAGFKSDVGCATNDRTVRPEGVRLLSNFVSGAESFINGVPSATWECQGNFFDGNQVENCRTTFPPTGSVNFGSDSLPTPLSSKEVGPAWTN